MKAGVRLQVVDADTPMGLAEQIERASDSGWRFGAAVVFNGRLWAFLERDSIELELEALGGGADYD